MKTRKTKKQKILAQKHRSRMFLFEKTMQKKSVTEDDSYFRKDLTKASLISMLAIVIELSIWKIFFR